MIRIFAILVALNPTVVAAQSHCNGQTQRDANICAHQKWQAADHELNRLCKEVKPLAEARGTAEALLSEQRVWLKQRDAVCDPELSAGGSAAPMIYWSCMEICPKVGDGPHQAAD